MNLVFKQDDIELRIGDKVILDKSKIPELAGFWKSDAGIILSQIENGSLVLEVKQREWLEVYFELNIYSDGKPITKKEFYDILLKDDNEPSDDDTEIYFETCRYMFLRYVVKYGAVKVE